MVHIMCSYLLTPLNTPYTPGMLFFVTLGQDCLRTFFGTKVSSQGATNTVGDAPDFLPYYKHYNKEEKTIANYST